MLIYSTNNYFKFALKKIIENFVTFDENTSHFTYR